jgi:hypothetical protein
MTTQQPKKKLRKMDHIPEILYEAPSYPGEKVSPIPYVVIPKNKDFPPGMFLLEYRETGELEIGDSGKPEDIMDGPYTHMMVDFNHISEVIVEQFPELNMDDVVDKLRVGLGLKPLAVAKKEGNEIIDRVVAKANDLIAAAQGSQQERQKRMEELLRDAKQKESK